MTEPQRQYCLLMDSRKYDRNAGCRAHDNAYGINGGGSELDRRRADYALFRRMRERGDPMAFAVLFFTRVYGWMFFNYTRSWPWRGQLIRKIWGGYARH